MLDAHMSDRNKVHYTPHSQRLKSSGNEKFTQKEVRLSDTPLYFAEGFEKVFLALYFVTLPYIAGLLFLFFYVAEGKYELFLSLDQGSSFILTWTIGYEVLAAITLLYIIKIAISFSKEISSKKNKKFQIP